MIDLVTVVFQQELFLLKTQARSIELYIEPHRLKNIYVVINDEDSIASLVEPSWWGTNAHKVKVIPRSRWDHAATLDGWSSQQLYKLLAANEAESSWSMCLDAKTWFVQQLDWDKLFAQDGRVRFRSFPTIDVFRPAQEFVEDYLNVNLPEVIGPGGVPFMFHTETVQAMFKHIGNLFEFFVEHVKAPYNVTEFMLYSGFVNYKYHSHDVLYTQEQVYCVTNLADWQVGQFDEVLDQMRMNNNLTASVQGRAYPCLSNEQLDKWCQFLLSKQLISDIQNAKFELNILR